MMKDGYQSSDICNQRVIELMRQSRRLRLEQSLSQRDISKRTGIAQGDISKIERGVIIPSLGVMSRIADAVGMEIILDMYPKGTSNTMVM